MEMLTPMGLRKGPTMSAVVTSPRIVRTDATTRRTTSRRPGVESGPAPSSRGERGAASREAAAPAARMRLTARGRRVGGLIALLVVGVFLLAGRAAAADDSGPLQVELYTVASGDTLWQIASRVTTHGEDVRDVVLRLEELNRMSSVDLRAGEQILIPALS